MILDKNKRIATEPPCEDVNGKIEMWLIQTEEEYIFDRLNNMTYEDMWNEELKE